MRVLRRSLLAVALVVATGLAVAPASQAISYRSCGGTLSGEGFWHKLGATGVSCSKARKVANDWIHRYYPQIKRGSMPKGVKYVDAYACKLTLNGASEPTGRVTCGFNSRHLRFYGQS